MAKKLHGAAFLKEIQELWVAVQNPKIQTQAAAPLPASWGMGRWVHLKNKTGAACSTCFRYVSYGSNSLGLICRYLLRI
jgi:hypothetical protein